MVFLEIMGKTIGYTLLMYGLWLLIGREIMSNAFQSIYHSVRRKRYIKRLNDINTQKEKTEKSLLIEHLELILLSASSKGKNVSVTNFLVLSSFVFVVVTSLTYILLNDLVIGIVIGLSISIVPYLSLRFKILNKRLKKTMLFMNNFHLIVQSYHSSGRSIYHMMMNLAKDIQDKELKLEFLKLSSAMQKNQNREDFNKAIQVFVYSLRSSAVIRFGNLLNKGYLDHSDISLPLQHLNESINARRNDLSEEKSQKFEVIVMGYIPLIILPIFLFIAYRVSNLYNFTNIFMSDVSIIFFIIAVLMTISSLFIVMVFSKPRTDI